MVSLKNYLYEEELNSEFNDIKLMLEYVGSAGNLYSGEKSKSKSEEDKENMAWTNRHGFRDGKIWHDVFTRDYSRTIYARLRQFFKNWFAKNTGFDISRGERVNAKHVTSIPASTKELYYIINGTRDIKKTANKKTGIDDLRTTNYGKSSNESLEDNSIISYRNLHCILLEDEKEDPEREGPSGFPGAEALMNGNNAFVTSKDNGINIYMDEKKRPLGISIISAPDSKNLEKFRETCKDEKYAECPHIFHLEFLKGLEDQWPEFFDTFVKDDIEKQFEMKKQTSKEKKEIKDEMKEDDDGLPPATERTITISYLDNSFAKFYETLGFKVYDDKNQLMVAVM